MLTIHFTGKEHDAETATGIGAQETGDRPDVSGV